jgi:hypothetical protein
VVSEVKSPAISPALQRRIAEHRLEVARLRQELGDPEEAMRRFVESTFSPEALIETFAEMFRDGEWIGDNADDVERG